MNLWIPPGADLGEFAGPDPDPMMNNFIGGLDAQGQPRPMTFRRLREAADSLIITPTTPRGPAALLETGREMFALSFYAYKMLHGSVAFSIFAVEAALKLRLGRKDSFRNLIDTATDRELITMELADIVNTGRRIRNDFIHEGKLTQWTFGMAFNCLQASYRLVSQLFPEHADEIDDRRDQYNIQG